MNRILILLIVILNIKCSDRSWHNPYDAQVKPKAPSLLSIESHSDSSLVLSWKDNSDIEQGYVVERANVETQIYTKISELIENSNSLLDSALNAAENYIYRIKTKTHASISKGSTIQAYAKLLIMWSLKSFTDYSDVTGFCFGPDNILFAIGRKYGNISIWDIANSTEKTLSKNHSADVTALCFHSANNTLISCYADGMIYFHNVLSGDINRFFKATNNRIKDVIYKISTETFFIFTDTQIAEYAFGTLQLVNTFSCKLPADINKENNLLCVTDNTNRSLKIWDLSNNTTLSLINNAHENEIKLIRFRNFSGQLVSCGLNDNKVKIWNYKESKLRHTITCEQNIEEIAITKNGRFIIIVGAAGKFQIYDLENYEILTDIEWSLTNIKLSQNGKLLAGKLFRYSSYPLISVIIYEWTGE